MVILSWKSEQKATMQTALQSSSPLKRSLSNEKLAGNSLKKKPERGVYHPPSGKYSHMANGAEGNDQTTNSSNGNANGNTSSEWPLQLFCSMSY
jgi:hypothetical protein